VAFIKSVRGAERSDWTPKARGALATSTRRATSGGLSWANVAAICWQSSTLTRATVGRTLPPIHSNRRKLQALPKLRLRLLPAGLVGKRQDFFGFC
jgi:hypothetical protein